MARNPAPWSRPYERALFTRQFVVTALPIACYFLPLPPTSLWAILYLAVGATVLNFIYYFLHLNGWFPRSFRWFRLVLDISLWTLLLHYTGGPGSLFFAGYLVEVLISAVAISAAGCLGAAAFSSAGFISLVLLDPQVLTAEQLISRMLILVLAGFLSWLLIRRLEEKNRLVESANRELSLRTDTIRRESDQLRRRLERLEQDSRAGREAAEMAHELRNTIHGLRGFVGLLRQDLDGDPRGSSLVDRIDTGVRSMQKMAEELLSFRRTGPGKMVPVDLGRLLGEAIAYCIPEGTRPKADISLEISAIRELAIPAHPELLRGAFINLIRNSLEAMTEGGKLTIRARNGSSGEIRIRFIDTGPGIPVDLRDRLFQGSVTGRAGGNGLGLALARRGVESHGGTLTLEATGPEGTTMTLSLPGPGKPSAVSTGVRTPKRVLAVEGGSR